VKVRIRYWAITLLLGINLASMSLELTAAESGPLALAHLYAHFEQAEERVDLTEAKLAVDRLIDPSIDANAVRRELERLLQTIKKRTPAGTNRRKQMRLLLSTLYEAGPWNGGRPFVYDLQDPFARNVRNKLLSTYLSTRKGNCVSMPILVVILGQRLGLPLTLTTAPAHVMAKFADDVQQAWVNVEATAGGFKYDSSYERELQITPAAIANGIYLRPLTARENVGVIASTLMEHYAQKKDADSLLLVAELALKANPKDTVAMVWKASAYYLQLQERYVRRYPNASDIPANLHADYRRLSRENLVWFAKAEELGWTQPTPAQEAEYQRWIQREKARKGQ
jgi:regulator of sirC expression with transglutaminase-like and TPR domain